MSYVFKVLLFFWFVVMSLLLSWDEMDVPVELIAYDAWAAEYDRIGFLNVEVDSLYQLFLKNDQFSWTWCKLVL